MIRVYRCLPLLLAILVWVATPAVADNYLAYSEKGIGQSPCDDGACYFQYCLEQELGLGSCNSVEPGCLWDCGVPGECNVPEGDSYQQHTAAYDINSGRDGYIGWGTRPLDNFANPLQPADMRDYAGDFRMFVRLEPAFEGQPHRVKVEFECDPDPVTYPEGISYVTFIADHGWQPNTNWQEIVVPLVDSSFTTVLDLNLPNASEFGFEEIIPFRPLDDACFSAVKAWSKVTLERVDLTVLEATLSTDFISWEKANNHSGSSNVTTDGRQLKVNGKPFVVNGFSYNPVDVGENWQFTWQDRADRYNVDYPLMADTGANTVRVYAPLISTAMLDKAWAEGLFVIPTFDVESTNLTCPEGKGYVQDRFVDVVSRWKDHPAILFWLIGNEVPSNLGSADLCADWYPTLDAMAAAGKAAEGASFHPVATANADTAGLSDICQAGCSDDTALPNVDIWGLQIYRGCTFETAFNDYAAKADCANPLIITEFGADAYNRPGGAPGSEDQTMQANCLDALLAEAHPELEVRTAGGVSSGQVLFSWTDEWWKADCSPTGTWSTHDTCPSWTSGYDVDPNVHEEWWGIASLNPADSAARTLRTSSDRVGDTWLGPICDMRVDAFDPGTGNATLSFVPPTASAVNTTMYYGPLSAVSTYGYSGSEAGLGTTGSANVTLAAGDLFWVIAPENAAGEEGCYGTDGAGTERPCFSGNCDLDQVDGWNCWCQ